MRLAAGALLVLFGIIAIAYPGFNALELDQEYPAEPGTGDLRFVQGRIVEAEPWEGMVDDYDGPNWEMYFQFYPYEQETYLSVDHESEVPVDTEGVFLFRSQARYCEQWQGCNLGERGAYWIDLTPDEVRIRYGGPGIALIVIGLVLIGFGRKDLDTSMIHLGPGLAGSAFYLSQFLWYERSISGLGPGPWFMAAMGIGVIGSAALLGGYWWGGLVQSGGYGAFGILTIRVLIVEWVPGLQWFAVVALVVALIGLVPLQRFAPARITAVLDKLVGSRLTQGGTRLYWVPLMAALIVLVVVGETSLDWTEEEFSAGGRYWRLVWWAVGLSLLTSSIYIVRGFRPKQRPLIDDAEVEVEVEGGEPPVRVFGSQGGVSVLEAEEVHDEDREMVPYVRYWVDAVLWFGLLPLVLFMIFWSFLVSLHFWHPLALAFVTVLGGVVAWGGYRIDRGRTVHWLAAGGLLSVVLVLLVLMVALPSYEGAGGWNQFNLFGFGGEQEDQVANWKDIDEAIDNWGPDDPAVPPEVYIPSPTHSIFARISMVFYAVLVPWTAGAMAWRYRSSEA